MGETQNKKLVFKQGLKTANTSYDFKILKLSALLVHFDEM